MAEPTRAPDCRFTKPAEPAQPAEPVTPARVVAGGHVWTPDDATHMRIGWELALEHGVPEPTKAGSS